MFTRSLALSTTASQSRSLVGTMDQATELPVQSNGDMEIEQPGTGQASRHTAYHCGMGGCPAVIRIQHGAAMPRATFYGHQRRQHPGQGPEFLLHI